MLLVLFMVWSSTSGCLSPQDKENIPNAPETPAVATPAEVNISENQSEDCSTRWYKTKKGEKLKGVALMIHGLNLRPDKMQPIASKLTEFGIDVLELSLRGHGDNYTHQDDMADDEARLDAFKAVSYPLWQNETDLAYIQVRKEAEQKNVPLFFIGYSLGALMGLDLFASRPHVSYDRMVLFSPATKIHAIHYLGRVLSPFTRLVIPSLGPESYLANRKGTPVAAYNALFDALKHFEKHASQKINIPTLVFIDEQDEFIPEWGLRKLIKEEKLDQWQLHIVQKGKDVRFGTFHHYIIDEYSVGKAVWEAMMNTAIRHLVHTEFPKIVSQLHLFSVDSDRPVVLF
jgi:alpha-beta hydrolase superfamily lysophospholipase